MVDGQERRRRNIWLIILLNRHTVCYHMQWPVVPLMWDRTGFLLWMCVDESVHGQDMCRPEGRRCLHPSPLPLPVPVNSVCDPPPHQHTHLSVLSMSPPQTLSITHWTEPWPQTHLTLNLLESLWLNLIDWHHRVCYYPQNERQVSSMWQIFVLTTHIEPVVCFLPPPPPESCRLGTMRTPGRTQRINAGNGREHDDHLKPRGGREAT